MILLTGFPGFLGSGLLPRVLDRETGAREATCLVERRFDAHARERSSAAVGSGRLRSGAVRVIGGDITAPDLGLGPAHAALRAAVTEVFHLAAVYDLAVRRDVGMRVNVEGTRNVLMFAAACPNLARLHYVSTCYVSGRYPGLFSEAQLVEGQRFNNGYEETKYLAEVLVRQAIEAGLPGTVYRPAIVVGDSRTGATQKYDGPYHTIRWLLRQPRIAVMPMPAGAWSAELNVVPSDYVLDAITHLSGSPESRGRTYHLADPRPLTVHAMAHLLAAIAGRRLVTLPVPLGVARAALAMPGFARLSPVRPEMLDYTTHPTRYDTAATAAALAGEGIECPPLGEYAERLVSFVRAHPDPGSATIA